MAEGIEKIVVPMDGSDASLRAYRLAKSLASASGIELHLLHVHQVEHGAATGMAHLSREEFARASADAGSRAFAEAGEEVDEERRHVCWGEPVEEILIFADRLGQAMVVMGRGGRSDLEHFLMGSVSDGVLRRSSSPVTLVH